MNSSFYLSSLFICCSNYHLFCIFAWFIFCGLIIYLIRFHHLFVLLCVPTFSLFFFFCMFHYRFIGLPSFIFCIFRLFILHTFNIYLIYFDNLFCIFYHLLFIFYYFCCIFYYQLIGFGSAVHVEASMISLAISLGRVYLRYSTYTET